MAADGMRVIDWSSDVSTSDLDPFFNALDGLVRVPESRVEGAELELSARVVEGLTVSAAATYIDAKVRHYQGIVGSVANEVGLFDPIRGDFSGARLRSEEHTSELQSLMRISYAVFCLKKKKTNKQTRTSYESIERSESIHKT